MKPKSRKYYLDYISRADRFSESLDPLFFKIDDRDTNDFLEYLYLLSGHFNYYNLRNEVDGNWEDFFLSDINIVVRLITQNDINNYIRNYDQIKKQLLSDTTDAELIKDLQQLFRFIYTFIFLQKRLHERFKLVHEDEVGISEFGRLVKEYNDYTKELRKLNSWQESARKQIESEFIVNFDLHESQWVDKDDKDEKEFDFFNVGNTHKEKIKTSLKHFDALFSTVRIKYYRLQEAADIFYRKREADGPKYLPHTGMILTFLDLFRLLKNDLNKLTGKHLDYYYKTILKQCYREAQPDKVYLQLEINPSLQTAEIPKGTALVFDKPGVSQNNQFLVDYDCIMTRAQIKQILSVYLSNKKTSIANRDIDEEQLFSSINPVYKASDFIVPNAKLTSWPLLGGDQDSISSDKIVMIPSDLGFLLSSSLLYARDGKRTFTVKLYLSNESYLYFKQLACKYASISNSSESGVLTRLLRNAFIIDITGDQGWIDIANYNISCDIFDAKDRFIKIDFTLGASLPATGVYRPEMHGRDYETSFPILRFKINNDASYNPYVFLKGLIMTRVSIQLDVSQSKLVKLRNNIGQIGTVNPFQLFGPQPAIGSYLDIKNTNIFNRYTNSFTINLHWFDLPRQEGGFAAYYDGYGNGITNDSFEVSLSGLNDGKFYPEDNTSRQKFSLFSLSDLPFKGNELSPVTVIKKIDFLLVKFDNMPGMDKEELISEAGFTEGTIKFELTAPQDAFGHRVFSGLFPEVVMNNAKFFKQKKALPNQPYIPVLKSVTVDYTLFHSEALNNIQQQVNTDNGLLIWHNYSFGYKMLYPQKKQTEFRVIPDISETSNVLLGLTMVTPGEKLSLLFQFEENNFDTTDYIEEKIKWSVLQDNEWLPIPNSDIMIDETADFTRSGIVVIQLPDVAGDGNTIFDRSLYWLKGSCSNRGKIRTNTMAVFAQVVSATRLLTDPESIHKDSLTLAPGTLKQFKKNNPQIINVFQPFGSFNGRIKENDSEFYTRVSEQLRHKNRAITSRDIAQLVLEAFPEIFKIKCFDNEINEQNQILGIDLLVVVIAKINPDLQVPGDYPKVDLSKLIEIEAFLKTIVSPFIKVKVINPVFEKVKVICSVVFNTDNEVGAEKPNKTLFSSGILASRLNEDIMKFISPWLYDNEISVNTEGKMYLSEILNYIKRRPYISYVTGFSAIHFREEFSATNNRKMHVIMDSAVHTNDKNRKIEYFEASQPKVILVSSPIHTIHILKNPQHIEPEPTGIKGGIYGGLIIGEEFLVVEPSIITASSDHDESSVQINNSKKYDFSYNPDNL